MQAYAVTMGRPGGGAGTFTAIVHALTPNMARSIAMDQYQGFSVHAVRLAR